MEFLAFFAGFGVWSLVFWFVGLLIALAAFSDGPRRGRQLGGGQWAGLLVGSLITLGVTAGVVWRQPDYDLTRTLYTLADGIGKYLLFGVGYSVASVAMWCFDDLWNIRAAWRKYRPEVMEAVGNFDPNDRETSSKLIFVLERVERACRNLIYVKIDVVHITELDFITRAQLPNFVERLGEFRYRYGLRMFTRWSSLSADAAFFTLFWPLDIISAAWNFAFERVWRWIAAVFNQLLSLFGGWIIR